ncbi:microfibrillar-associated protein 5 [Odocoileus virginianus]|uniref:Microfibrillar-associated protein 5 n=1 Tax=Odocoileus virginianus TaxID=9874 RepID=A0A6J0Y523_ODOVR
MSLSQPVKGAAPSLSSVIITFGTRVVVQIRSPFQGVALFILLPSQSGTEKERDTFSNQRTRWKEQRTINNMVFFGPKVLLLLTALIMSSGRTPLGVSGQRGDDVTTVTSETFTEDPNLVNDPATDETVLADIKPSTDDLASLNDKNTTTECRDEKFACTRLYSVHRPIKQCLHQICFTSSRRMYVINNEICSRLVCKEHEAMKDELCRQKAGLPPRRLRRSNYFRLPPCDSVNLQGPSGL